MSDIINKESNATITHTVKKYPITDAVAKAFFIDGLGAMELLSMPLIAPALLPALPVLTLYQIAGAAAINIVAAVPAYYLRVAAREEGHEYYGGMAAGAFKYIYREIYKNIFGAQRDVVEGIEIKALLGALNNLGYEVCANYDICSDNIGNNVAFTMSVEGIESMMLAVYQGVDVVRESQVGTMSGFIYAINANYLYDNSIDTIHQMVDHMYE